MFTTGDDQQELLDNMVEALNLYHEDNETVVTAQDIEFVKED